MSIESRRPCADCLPIQEAEHRIANHLSLLGALVRLKASDLDAESGPDRVAMVMSEIQAHIHAVARLHRTLATRPSSDLVDLGEYLTDVCALFSAGLASDAGIVLDCPPGHRLQLYQMMPIAQIVIEALTNALKHAQGHQCARVRCEISDDGKVLVEVMDSGPGLPRGVDPRAAKGIGMALIRRLAEKIAATVDFVSSEGGVTFRLMVPACGMRVPAA